jgi:hypothetical protein
VSVAASQFGMHAARLVVTREPGERLPGEAHQRRARRRPMAGIAEQTSDEVLGEALGIGGHAEKVGSATLMSALRTAMA